MSAYLLAARFTEVIVTLMHLRRPVLLAAFLLPLAAGTTAGEAPAGTTTEAAAPARWLTPYFREGTYRWLDIADRPYSSTFRALFKYSSRQVLAKYTRARGKTLGFELIAHGLKPNFAYQVKLEGQPTKPFPWTEEDLADPRNWSNKALGDVGRWWCVDCNYNVSDWSLEGGYHQGHRLLGYLLLDFFVTDANGSARRQFAVDGSYHVLWKVSQYPPGADDSQPRLFRPVGTKLYGYEADLPAQEVSLYLEQEYGRAHKGEVKLPAGNYQCRLLLTEESFHSYSWSGDDNPGGHWCHCLSDEALQFTIVP